MSYLYNYKQRVSLGEVTNTREKLIYQAKRQFEKSLQIDPSSLLLKVTNTDEVNISEDTREIKVIVNDYALNDQRAFDEKILLTRIEDKVNVGCYVEFDGFIWLVNFEEHISVPSHKKFIMKKCNQILKYKYGEVIYDIPVVVKNLVQYSDGMQDIVFTSMPDSKRSIIYGVNYITKNIVLGDRLMINKSGVYRVTHIDDFQYNANYDDHTGIATATIAHTTANNLDNFDLVDTADGDGGLVRSGERDVLLRLKDHRMAVADGDVEGGALRLGAVTGTDQVQGLGEASAHAGDHVRDQGAIQAVESAVLLLIVRADNVDHVAFNLHGDILVDLLGQRALRALHGDKIVIADGNRDAGRDGDRSSSDSRHCFYLRFSVVNYQM